MASTLARYEQACAKGNEGLLCYQQEAYEHGPRAVYYDSVGHAFVSAARLASSGGIVLGLWSTGGFDWMDKDTAARWPGPTN